MLEVFEISLSIARSDLGVNLLGTSTPRKIGNCLKCFPLVNNLPYCRIKLFKLVGHITLPTVD